MAWLKNLWNNVSGQSADELTLVSDLRVPGATHEGEPIREDQCYLELYVDSLRLEKARRFATNFHGVVYAFQQMAREGSSKAELAALSKPDKLARLDQESIGRVITLSRKLIGPVPWRGGTLHLELGLFSVKSGDVLSPMLDFVTEVSTTAGISFIGTVTPFVPLVAKGLDLLAGQAKEVSMEVGIDTDLDPQTSSSYAIINRAKRDFDISRLRVDADHKLLVGDTPLECAYCVFSIRQTRRKADYGEIPELKQQYASLVAAIRSNSPDLVQAALCSFRLAVLTSPELIPSDAERLVAKATAKASRALTRSRTAGSSRAANLGEELADLDLYDEYR